MWRDEVRRVREGGDCAGGFSLCERRDEKPEERGEKGIWDEGGAGEELDCFLEGFVGL